MAETALSPLVVDLDRGDLEYIAQFAMAQLFVETRRTIARRCDETHNVDLVIEAPSTKRMINRQAARAFTTLIEMFGADAARRRHEVAEAFHEAKLSRIRRRWS